MSGNGGDEPDRDIDRRHRAAIAGEGRRKLVELTHVLFLA